MAVSYTAKTREHTLAKNASGPLFGALAWEHLAIKRDPDEGSHQARGIALLLKLLICWVLAGVEGPCPATPRAQRT
jgi:hypothetical protein